MSNPNTDKQTKNSEIDVEPPEKIYLQFSGVIDEATWCVDKINDNDIEYTRTKESK